MIEIRGLEEGSGLVRVLTLYAKVGDCAAKNQRNLQPGHVSHHRVSDVDKPRQVTGNYIVGFVGISKVLWRSLVWLNPSCARDMPCRHTIFYGNPIIQSR